MSQSIPMTLRSHSFTSILNSKILANPASANTSIVVNGPPRENVNLRIYNVLGQVVRELTTSTGSNGSSQLPVDLTGLAAGSYLVSGETVGLTSKIMLSVKH